MQVCIRKWSWVLSTLSCVIVAGWRTPAPEAFTAAERGPVEPRHATAPIRPSVYFEANRGQAAGDVAFIARGLGGSAEFTSRSVRLTGGPRSPEVELTLSTHRRTRPVGADRRSGVASYLLGNDPSAWVRGAATYGKVRYDSVTAGIDVIFYDAAGQLEFDVQVLPGHDAEALTIGIDGATPRLDAAGDLHIGEGPAGVRLRRPVAFQVVDGARVPVASRFVLRGRRLGFDVGDYDRALPLVIDPVVVFATYFGGGFQGGPFCCGPDQARAIAVDGGGHIYVAGSTVSSGFPQTALVGTYANDSAFVAKFTGSGALVYSTVFGGSGNDGAVDVKVDGAGNAYVLSSIDGGSTDFPTLAAFQPLHGGGVVEAAVTKLSADGTSMLWSSFLGGSAPDGPQALAVDAAGAVYVTGATQSADFPMAGVPYQGVLSPRVSGTNPYDAFVTKIAPDGQTLVYSTFIGKTNGEAPYDIVVDAAGQAIIGGYVDSPDYPTTAGAFMTSFSGQGGVAMVTKLNASGSSLVFSTFLGGNTGTDQISALALDAAGNIVAAGLTNSTDFPIVAPAVQTALGSAGTELDAFVATLSSDGSAVLQSTYLGGASHDFALDVAVDVTGALAVSGATASANFPVADAVQGTLAGDLDMFVAKISADGASLAFSSFVGGTAKDGVLENSCCLHGVAIDPAGAIVMAGNTFSTDLATVNAYQPSNGGSADVFVIKLVDVVTVAIDVKPGSHPNSINLGANGTVPVAILSSATFDATSVDPLTVTLASAPVRLKGKGTPMASVTDVNGDGRLDLVAHVSTEALQLSESDTLAVLEGRTSAGLTIRGSDSIRVVR